MATGSRHKGEGHRQRLRERFLDSGLDGFQDYEVIELLLTLATPRKDCKTAAKAVLARFSTLQDVMEASPRALCEVRGIGPRNIFGIRLIKAVADRYLQKRIVGRNVLNNSARLFDYLYHRYRDKPRECFEAIYLDAKNRVITTRTLFQGTLTTSAVYPREVVLSALENHAAAVIFVHNHPSGEPEPSPEDHRITRQLVFACNTLGIRVHEHIIIGNDRYYSFADNGLIERFHRDFEVMSLAENPPGGEFNDQLNEKARDI